MEHAVSTLIAHRARWIGAVMATQDASGTEILHSTVVRISDRTGCCGAIASISGYGFSILTPSLAWVEGDPAIDDRILVRAPSSIICELTRTPTVR